MIVPDDAKLGVIRLDYDYPPIPGDVDSPDSFSYDVVYRTVPGLTFEMAQFGKYVIMLKYFIFKSMLFEMQIIVFRAHLKLVAVLSG